jgi:cell division protein FtsA
MKRDRKEKPLVGVDVGSSKIVVLIGYQTGEETFDIVGKGEVSCDSMRKGVIVEVEEAISALSEALEEAERMSGQPVDNAVLSIGGGHISATNSKGVIAVSRPDGEITEEDLDRVIEAARAISQPTNREILHVVPCAYTVDGQEGIKSPIGMTGIRLEVKTHVIASSSPAVKNLTKSASQAGLNVQDIVFSGLADSYPLLSQKDKEIGVGLADIGGETTDLIVFEEGDIIHSAVIPIGSAHITHDIAIGLKTSVDIAEKIKIKYGSTESKKTVENEMIDLKEFDSQEDQTANKKYLAEIIEARSSELLNLIREELKKVDRDGMLPAGLILTGGGSKLNGLVNLAKEVVRLPIKIGQPQIELTGLVDQINDPRYNTAVGLLMWSAEKGISRQSLVDISQVSGMLQKIKDWLKQFVT